MKNLHALVNEANKKVAAKKRWKVVPTVDQLVAGSGLGSTSSHVVDLEEGGRCWNKMCLTLPLESLMITRY